MVPRRTIIVLGSLLLLVGAGCQGLGTQTQSTDAVTPENATAVPDTGNYRVDWVVRTNTSGAFVPEEIDETIWVGRDGAETHRITKRAGLSPENYTQFYATEHRRYVTNYHAKGAKYSYRYDGDGVNIVLPPDTPHLESVTPMLARGAFSYDGTTTENGTTFHRYVASEPSDSYEGIITNYSATVLVSEDGVVETADGSFTHPRHGQHVEFSWDVERDIEAPERPDWIEEIPTLTLSKDDDGRTAVLEHDGGVALASNTTLRASAIVGDETIRGTVRVEEPLTPGERRYVYVVETEKGYEFRLSKDRPAGDAAVPFADGSLSLVKMGSLELALWTGEDDA